MEAAEQLRILGLLPDAGSTESTLHPYAARPVPASETVLRLQLAAAQNANAYYRLILEAAGDGIYGLDTNGSTTFINPAAEALTGWQSGELDGKPLHETIHHSYADGKTYPRSSCPMLLALSSGQAISSDDEVFWRKDGSCFPVSYACTPILRDGQVIGATVIFRDISLSKRREAWEKNKNSIFLAITNKVPLTQTLGMIAASFVELFPTCAIAVMTRNDENLHLVADAALPASLQAVLSSVALGNAAFACTRATDRAMEILIRRMRPGHALDRGSDQSTAAFDPSQNCRELTESGFTACLAVPLLSATGDVLGVVSFFDTEDSAGDWQATNTVNSVCDLVRLAIDHQNLHAELTRQSQHDQLTGLPNRLLLEDRLERAIVQARRRGNQVAVCYVDLDHFKEINDTLGHRAGDQVLQQVTEILKKSLREIDTVARQGGDEFLLILPELSLEAEADEICNRVMSNLQQPIQVGKHMVTVSASIGRCTYPASGQTASGLLQNAEIALYTAKRGGRDRIQRFTSVLGEKVQRDIGLQRELRHALDRDQFHLVYQPIFSLDAQLKGFEALIRWDHPIYGPVGPDRFIALAEESGQIVSIGDWVLNEACRQACEWNAGFHVPIKMYVNVSGVQLSLDTFTASVSRALTRSGLTPSLLELEITETSVIADTNAVSHRLRELRQLGIHISIDDFGCGHSSFSYLQQLPIDGIKIDRSFIAVLDGTDKKSAIVRTIVALADELGLQTVAEGVETGQQFEELQSIRCSLVQGYLLSKPLMPADARQLLTHSRALPFEIHAGAPLSKRPAHRPSV